PSRETSNPGSSACRSGVSIAAATRGPATHSTVTGGLPARRSTTFTHSGDDVPRGVEEEPTGQERPERFLAVSVQAGGDITDVRHVVAHHATQLPGADPCLVGSFVGITLSRVAGIALGVVSDLDDTVRDERRVVREGHERDH